MATKTEIPTATWEEQYAQNLVQTGLKPEVSRLEARRIGRDAGKLIHGAPDYAKLLIATGRAQREDSRGTGN